ncbi:MAG TPA: hypothetical protein VFP55_00270 [Solirubrobacteraceae bacterium]|nr:hypothetical protein [Solirubrobacteraceae bacterium]
MSSASRIPQPALPAAPTLPGYPPPARSEPHWPPQATILIAIVLQILLPDRLAPGPRWLLPVLEALVLVTLFIASPQRVTEEHTVRRRLALGVTALVSIANAVSLVLLVSNLLHRNVTQGKVLIVAGLLVWLTNILLFSLWFWETDRGGPGRRAAAHDGPPDFLFPQMLDDRLSPGWRPVFLDYLYVSLTNAAAFSPTDTMPLTVMAKALMGLQSVVSLVTIGLVVSRAINIL